MRDFALIISDTEDQASDFLKSIADELDENEALRKAFKIDGGKDRGFDVRNETEIIVSMDEGKHKFCIRAKGSGQKVRGKWWRKKRPNLIICDDLENDDIVLNKDRRRKFQKWFDNALLPSLSDDGQIVVVGTILHQDSLLEGLMPKNNKEKGIHVIETPLAEYTNKVDDWKAVRFRAHSPNYEHILWEAKFPKERLQAIYQRYARKGNTDGYSQEYLNVPIDEATAMFRKSDLIPMTESDHDKRMTYYVGGDFAISERDTADWTVLVVIGVDQNGICYLVNVYRDRADTFDIVDTMEAINIRYHPELWFFEGGSTWLAVENVLLREQGNPERTLDIPYDVIPPVTDKVIRARPFQYMNRAGQFKVDKEADWYDTWEEEILAFPRGSKDDQVDGTSVVMAKLRHILNAPSDEELDEEEYEDMEDDVEYDYGISHVTGY